MSEKIQPYFLIIEDDRSSQRMVRRILLDLGWQQEFISICGDKSTALAVIRELGEKGLPFIALVDGNLSDEATGNDGREVITEVNTKSEYGVSISFSATNILSEADVQFSKREFHEGKLSEAVSAAKQRLLQRMKLT